MFYFRHEKRSDKHKGNKMKSISVFSIIKNEVEYVGYGLMSILDYVDEICYADGNSTDGTIELIEHIKSKYDKDNKIKLFKDKDCMDLQESYLKLNNWILNQCTKEYAWFLHPDMICLNPEKIREMGDALRYTLKIASIAGERRELKIKEGRSDTWATIYKNAFGLHYHGYYGAQNEDLYFKDITEDEYIFWKELDYLPYEIADSGIRLYHYCDTKPYQRRLGRMKSVLKYGLGFKHDTGIEDIAKNHPRVTLQDSGEFKFEEFIGKQPEVFEKYKEEFDVFKR